MPLVMLLMPTSKGTQTHMHTHTPQCLHVSLHGGPLLNHRFESAHGIPDALLLMRKILQQ